MPHGNRLNAGRPADDFAVYGATVTKAIASVVAANGTAEDPMAYAEKVAHRFFPNVLPYVVGTPAVFGFAEWNGRSLTDNAPNVMFSIAANTPVALGIGKESSDVQTVQEISLCAHAPSLERTGRHAHEATSLRRDRRNGNAIRARHGPSIGPRSTLPSRTAPLRSVGASAENVPMPRKGASAVGVKSFGSWPNAAGKLANQPVEKSSRAISSAPGSRPSKWPET